MDLDRGGVDPREPSHPPVAVATADSSACPRLVLLPHNGKRTDDFSVVADAKTTSAASSMSTGRRFRVSFGLLPSPQISSFLYGWEDRLAYDDDRYLQRPIVHAAHKDCVLFEVTTPSAAMSSLLPRPPPDYFLYQASTPERPPSLLLLPPCYSPRQYDRHGSASAPRKPRHMVRNGTGLLRRGDDDILVAQLELKTPENKEGELCWLRPGRDREWQLNTMVPIVVDEDDNRQDEYGDGPLRWWETDAAFAVGGRFLCWVDYLRGFLFIDMADESSLRLRYAPLPVVPPSGDPYATEGGRSNMAWTRNLAPAGDNSVRFVDVASRCCCGDPGSTRCERGRFLFTVATWTLKLSMDEPMEWLKDGVLDCDELWAQPGYTGLPRVTVEHPIVGNSDDPDAVCFVVRTDYRCYSMDSVDIKVWTIQVDTRRKVLRSVVQYNGSDIHHPTYGVFPAKILY